MIYSYLNITLRIISNDVDFFYIMDLQYVIFNFYGYFFVFDFVLKH